MTITEALSPAPPEESKVKLPLLLLAAPTIILPRGLTAEEQRKASALEKEFREADKRRRWNGTLWPEEPQRAILP